MIGLNRREILIATFVTLIVFFSVMPAQGATNFGRWRDINPTQYSLTDVSGTLRGIYIRNGGSGSIGAGDGWAVGGDGPNGIISHYDGFSWQIYAPPVAGEYNSANFCLSPGAPGVGSLCNVNGDGSDGWLVGGNGATVPVATYWDGTGLTEQITGLGAAGNLTSVFMVCHSPQFSLGCSGPFNSAGLTYAVGTDTGGTAGIICDWNGNPKAPGGWSCPFTSVAAGNTAYNGVYMFVDQNGNLGGFAVGYNGWIARLSSGSWVDSQPAPGVIFRSVFVDQGGNNLEAWAVGDAVAGSAEIWHFCCGPAGSWTGPVSPGATPFNLESVFLVSNSEGWAVGSGSVILHSTTLGTSNQWLALTNPSQTATGPAIALIGVSFPSSGNGWAVGSNGVILNTQNSNCGNGITSPCWGGNTGITQISPATAHLATVFEVSQSDAWAGGLWDAANTLPALMHWDGQKWHRAQVAPPASLGGLPFDINGIYMSGSSDGWAVGGDTATGLIPFAIHWDGNSWTGSSASQPVGCTCSLTSVFMINSGEGWAVGTTGQFYHYTTSTNQWGLVQVLGLAPRLNSVFISNPGNNLNAGWAVGDGGVVAELSISGGSATWNPVTISALGGATPNLNGVFFTDSNHGWIVGASATVLSTTDGGQTWSGGIGQVIGAPATAVLRSVYVDQFGTGSGNGDGWAVGDDGTGPPANALFAHWDGQIWTATAISPSIAPGLAVYSVYGQPGNTQDGWAVGAGPSGVTNPLAGVFHLDPLNPPIGGGGAGTGAGTTTITITSGSSTTTSTSTSPTTTVTSISTSVITESTTSTSSTLSTATSTSTSTEVSTSVVSNTLQAPGIPGFPWESIVVGIIFGLVALGIIRRIKKK